MLERLICAVGFLMTFLGLLGGIFFRTEGLTICFVGLIIMLFGLFFIED